MRCACDDVSDGGRDVRVLNESDWTVSAHSKLHRRTVAADRCMPAANESCLMRRGLFLQADSDKSFDGTLSVESMRSISTDPSVTSGAVVMLAERILIHGVLLAHRGDVLVQASGAAFDAECTALSKLDLASQQGGGDDELFAITTGRCVFLLLIARLQCSLHFTAWHVNDPH